MSGIISILSGLLTPVIAIVVAWIAYQQWRTARTRLNLDLFEKRMDVYDRTFGNAALIIRKGTHLPEAKSEFFQAWRSSQFLFGPEVSRELEEVVNALFALERAAEVMDRDLEESERRRFAEIKSSSIKRVDRFRHGAYELFRPYMRFDEKRVRTFGEWVSDRNRLRLSYANRS